MPDARAFWASRAMSCSIFFPLTIIRSASSSTTTTMRGIASVSRPSPPSSPAPARAIGSGMGSPAFTASVTLRLNPARFLTPSSDITR